MAIGISIVIPFYEKKRAFKKTFNELKLQLNPDDEVIVVDDHSPSGIGICGCQALTIVRPPKLDQRIHRLNTLRNLGIRSAKNDAVTILAPDCIPNPHFLENARRVFDPSVLFTGNQATPGEGSRWLDDSYMGAWKALDGCMLFSRSRAKLVGLFDTEYDSGWGAEDHDFGARCYHSGIRLRYEPGLKGSHQHHLRVHPNQQRNMDLWAKKRMDYKDNLHRVTPYNPEVGVLVATLERPYYIDQVMRAIFRTRMPLKVRLVNQGDRSPKQMEALKCWRGRWAVDVIDNPEPRKLSEIRTEAMEAFGKEGYRYMLTLDDDILPHPGSIEALIRALAENPQYHAIAGGVIQKGMNRMLGGYITHEEGETQHHVLPLVKQTAEVQFVSSGFTAFKLDPLIPYDTEYDFGWNDWDWSQEIRKAGLRMAVCGDAVAHHKYLVTSKGIIPCYDSAEYNLLRRDIKRNEASKDRFKKKWGFEPAQPKLWDKPVRRVLPR